MKVELLAPVGDFEKLKYAINYGADAVYMAGKNYGLRAFCSNFELDALKDAVKLAHNANKKVYITLNIYAYEEDFDGLSDYIKYLSDINVDAVIVSDIGIIKLIKTVAPNLSIHLSTQANTTNSYAAAAWVEMGVDRIVLARELSLDRIKKLRDKLDDKVELEAFVHGAMCIAYSGRCLISNFLTNRASNHGECVQSCRWEYNITEVSRTEPLTLTEDERGSYILNSRDINMLEHLDKLAKAGVTSFKIEGRNKSIYYLSCVVNAYRRAIDLFNKGETVIPKQILDEPYKTSHRKFCTSFYFGEAGQCYETSRLEQEYEMCAVVLEDRGNNNFLIEHRNRFNINEVLEVLSSHDSFNCLLQNFSLTDEIGKNVTDANRVQQKLVLNSPIKLYEGDILRKKTCNKK